MSMQQTPPFRRDNTSASWWFSRLRFVRDERGNTPHINECGTDTDNLRALGTRITSEIKGDNEMWLSPTTLVSSPNHTAFARTTRTARDVADDVNTAVVGYSASAHKTKRSRVGACCSDPFVYVTHTQGKRLSEIVCNTHKSISKATICLYRQTSFFKVSFSTKLPMRQLWAVAIMLAMSCTTCGSHCITVVCGRGDTGEFVAASASCEPQLVSMLWNYEE